MRLKLIGFVLATLVSAQMSYAAMSPYADREVNSALERVSEGQQAFLKEDITAGEFSILLKMTDNVIEACAEAEAAMKGIELAGKWFMTEARARKIMYEAEAEVLRNYYGGKESILHGVERTD